MGSNNEEDGLSPEPDNERSKYINDGLRSINPGQKDDLYSKLWHTCAGPLVNVPRAGDRVFYFPQGHIEQVEAFTNQDAQVEMPIYNIPYKIFCKVVYVQLKVEACTDEVFAQITLLPEVKSFVSSPQEESCLKNGTSLTLAPRKSKARLFSKRLTPSDTSTHGGFSVPKRNANECFPPLDMSQQPSAQELVAKDLHGVEWRFRHIYRGQPKRHLLTSGWSTFVSAKKLAAGDACIFLRGENGELYVGVHRATKPQNSTSASVISGHSMQHGILASAFHAISTGTMFTVYYRPWTSPSEFIIPYDRYMKLAENDFSVGTKFRMQFEGEEERKCSRFAGTVVGVDDIDCIRWPGSEWRCLKVLWDSTTRMPVRPERVSPWSIELIEVKKKKHTSTLPHQKRSRPLDPSSTPGFHVLAGDDLVKNSVGCTPERHSGVLQGQEIRTTGAHELVASTQPPLPQFISQSNPDWGHRQMGLENRLYFQMHDQFHERPGNMISVSGGNFLNTGLANYCPPMSTSHGHDSVEVSRSMSIPNINSSSSVSQDWKASEERDETEAPVALPNGSGRYMLFGVNIFNCHPELPSPQVMSSSELHSAFSAPPAASQSSISESVQVSLPSNSISGNLPKKQCKNCSSVSNRSCTKVLKHGTALGRSIDLSRFDGYDELIFELDQMFDFKGTLIDGRSGWHVTYTDGEVNIVLNGNYPWLKFRSSVRKLLICPKEDIDHLEPSSPNLVLL